jgi:hypothetical protein
MCVQSNLQYLGGGVKNNFYECMLLAKNQCC